MFNAFRRPLALALSATLAFTALTACASWDSPSGSTNAELIEEIQSEAGSTDPRTFTGMSLVEDIGDVVPVADNPTPNLPVSLTDADGNDVTITDVSRILPLDLYGTYSKTIAGLGLVDNIVGRTVSSTEPALADAEVVTTGGHNLNAEAILNLHPSVVIIDHSIGPREVIEQIRAAGIPTVTMSPNRSIDSIGEDIKDIAAVVGLPEEGEKLAERSVAEVEEARTVVQDLAPDDPLKMVFLYARGTGGVFFILGDAYGGRDLIEGLGGVDMAAEKGIMDLAPANAEALAELNPDVFVMMSEGLVSTGGIEGLMQRPGIAQTTAGQHQRVLALPDGQSLAFGAQTGELLLRASRELYLQGGE
ncbi:ABC transporter periplasmic component [Corynebacterium deserti GIMN1.010]|uniref:ABC transporter periplasmic component n=1 Tax=Corynebacterium deserti GIMN1.010 TaxID=931089 RepID=A0A0M5IFR2_9CORY|nr:hemin ABC transporter substrate-binding protein [Corynebacterium deserti]ALC04894.1 ABC transporter periplasmic component [Corynebacterium deserti GIMN1.010]